MTDTLNDILVECARLRGCYPLMHRTLHEFDWFCSCAIFGAEAILGYEILRAENGGDSKHATALRDRQTTENGIRARFKSHYSYGDDELVRLAEAFLVYCREEYADEVDVETVEFVGHDDGETHVEFVDKRLEAQWVAYHRDEARFSILTPAEHKKRHEKGSRKSEGRR
ncbi:MAG: hypothetical protein WC343_01250 [Bacilli bacterium]|jgi:hypothetical protein